MENYYMTTKKRRAMACRRAIIFGLPCTDCLSVNAQKLQNQRKSLSQFSIFIIFLFLLSTENF